MKRIFEILMLGLAIIFFSSLQGCAWTPEMSTMAKEQAMCVNTAAFLPH